MGHRFQIRKAGQENLEENKNPYRYVGTDSLRYLNLLCSLL